MKYLWPLKLCYLSSIDGYRHIVVSVILAGIVP